MHWLVLTGHMLYQIADSVSSNQVCKVNSCLDTGPNCFLHGKEVRVENQKARGGKPELEQTLFVFRRIYTFFLASYSIPFHHIPHRGLDFLADDSIFLEN